MEDRPGGSLLRYMKQVMDDMRMAGEQYSDCSQDEANWSDGSADIRDEALASSDLSALVGEEFVRAKESLDGQIMRMDIDNDITPRHNNRQKAKTNAAAATTSNRGQTSFVKRRRNKSTNETTIAEYRFNETNHHTLRHKHMLMQDMQHQPHNSPVGLSPSVMHSPSEYFSNDEFYYDHKPIVTPANQDDVSTSTTTNELDDATTLATNIIRNPFYSLEQELHTMKSAHRTISELLNTKVSNENYLQSRLAKLEQSHASLQKKYNSLSKSHSELIEKTKVMERSIGDKHHEIQILKTKESAVSAELATRLREADNRQCKLNELTESLKNEQYQRAALENELHNEKMTSSKLKDIHDEMTLSNNDMAQQLAAAVTERQSLMHCAAVLREELVAKEKQLVETKTKETSLCEQLMAKLSLLDSSENKSREMEVLLTKERGKNLELERKLLAVQKKASNDTKVLKRMEEKSLKVQSLLEEEQAKNLLLECELSGMRDKVQAAKEGLAYLQRDKINGPALAPSTAVNHEDMDELEAPSQSLVEESGLTESIELLSPIFRDVLNIQQDTNQRVRQLLQKANATRHFIEQISNTSTSSSLFQPTLQLLEEILTSHIKIIRDLDDAIEFEGSCQSKMSLLFDIPPQQFFNTAIPLEQLDGRANCIKFKAAMQNHIKKIESLHKMAFELQPINKLLDGANKIINKKHNMHLANEITLIFQQAMATLLQDTKEL